MPRNRETTLTGKKRLRTLAPVLQSSQQVGSDGIRFAEPRKPARSHSAWVGEEPRRTESRLQTRGRTLGPFLGNVQQR